MRKIFLLFAFVAIVSCVKDPWQGINTGDWNHEHSIVDIKFEGQAGLPVISNIDQTNGTVELKLATNKVSDMSKVKLDMLQLSYNCSSNVKAGETIDFVTDTPTIVVNSPNGESRTYTLLMTEFTETLGGKYKITGSMVLGGTGHEYGGTGLMAPESKSWCWSSDGFGPNAEYDNYLDIVFEDINEDGNSYGTCMHYAGVDEKFWNCMFLASQNKEGTNNIDLRHYYRNIPIGLSTWVRNYSEGTITFTDKDGKVTVGALYDSGEYTLLEAKGQGPAKIITVENQAFAFKINGVDDWTNNYSDYDKFAKKAMAHFVMVEKVDDIPTESMTEGSEGEINTDPAPTPEPEPAAELTGTYMISGMNVFTGTDPDKNSMLNLYDKDFCFNSSFYSAKDDILILEATGRDAYGNEIGTADYQPGANNKYWDYMMLEKIHTQYSQLSGDLDCSDKYDMIPHGKSTYTYNATEATLVFKVGVRSVAANLLLGGQAYDFTYGKTTKSLSVTADMALDFAIDTEEKPTVWGIAYQNFDNMYYSVHNYIIHFSRQD